LRRPAAGVVGEAMVAIVLADAVLEKFGGDSLASCAATWTATSAQIARAVAPADFG
jgi:chorismate synthase